MDGGNGGQKPDVSHLRVAVAAEALWQQTVSEFAVDDQGFQYQFTAGNEQLA